MKRVFVLLTVLMLCGCASLLEGPNCGYSQNSEKKVSKSELVAVIGFADGSSEISAQNKEVLRQVAEKAMSEKAKIVVYGHASHRTITKNILQRIFINLKISNERAVKTAATLISYGVETSNVNTLALFDSRPIKVEVDRAAEAANRRAEIYLYWLE
ncbi:MAG: OmpA family protein [Alphaproteobacteria bacterium]|nr:OmpA family protein [Alphaproteobacteria bacterium]